MSDVHAYLWLIPALPLLAAGLITFLGYPVFRQNSHWVCIGGAVGACILSVMLLTNIRQLPHDTAIESYYTWFQAGNVDVGFSLRADGLTAIMLVMVTFIGSLIAIYSAGYMHADPGYPRFFAEVSLFLFFMTGLVLANNFLVLYACWEGVGLCSYLLIGFWFAKPSAAAAARKAFLVTRLGDIGLLIGILILWNSFGNSLEFDRVFAEVTRQWNAGTLDHNALFWACVCLFLGAAGKSAQFPLH